MATETSTDTMDMFTEMPERVKVAILSNMQGLRSRCAISFLDYDRTVADYIAASGLMTVHVTENMVRFSANEQTAVLKANLRACLEMVGFGF